jgi:competence protein ComEC
MKRQMLFLLAGLLLVAARFFQTQADFKKIQAQFSQPQRGVFKAWIAEEPEVLFEHLPGSHDTGRDDGTYQSFVREVRAICTVYSADGISIPPVKTRCTFRLSYEVPQPVLSYGESVEIDGKIQAPPPAMNPGQFDYAHYLRTKGVAYVIYAGPGKWHPLRNAGSRGSIFLRWANGLKRKADNTLYRYLPYPENALLDGILLGERASLPDEMVQSFFLTGTIHILAVSGMITAFIAGLLFTVFRALQIKRKWAAGLTLIGLLFFVFMTGAHPPVCRAGLFSALALVAVLFERRIHGGVLLMTTAILLVFLNPFVLEDLSFQISFLATAGLMVMASWMMEKLSFLWRPAALLVTSTTAAQLAVWCLIIYDFNQLSLYSILSNLVIVPLALFSTAGGLVLLAGAFLHPALGNLFGAACEVPLTLLIYLSDKLAQLPKAEWIVASPPLAWVILFHALLLFSFLCFWPGREPESPSENWKRKKRIFHRGRQLSIGLWTLFLMGTGIFWFFSVLRSQPFRITFLDVGNTNAVVLRSSEGKILVIDGGKGTHGPDRYQPVVAYLRHLGIQKIDAVLETHPDRDRADGLVNILSAFPTGSAFAGFKLKTQEREYGAFQEALQDHGIRPQELSGGSKMDVLKPAVVLIEHPPADYLPRTHPDNNRSVVILVSFGSFRLLLAGDLQKEGLLKIMKNHQPFPKMDWLMAPYHGRMGGEPALCASRFHPQYVVLSDWKDNPQTRKLYQEAGAVVFSTSDEGAIEVEVEANGKDRYRTFRENQWKAFETTF